jgi:hypothetical protein
MHALQVFDEAVRAAKCGEAAARINAIEAQRQEAELALSEMKAHRDLLEKLRADAVRVSEGVSLSWSLIADHPPSLIADHPPGPACVTPAVAASA